MLIELDKVFKHEITLLNIKIDLINKLNLINISSFITAVMINNKESLIYQIID